MKASVNLLLLAGTVMFFFLGCSESSFKGDSKTPPKKDHSQDANPVKPDTTEPNNAEIPKDENVLETIDDLDIGQQEGRSVEACFAYNNEKVQDFMNKNTRPPGKNPIGHHSCDNAVFDVFFSGQQAGQINLNNGTTGDSVHGGTLLGKWVNGEFELETRCAISACHEGIAFLSLIGEVVTPSGKMKWLKIDQGIIDSKERYKYKFAEFELSDVKPTFGPLCELDLDPVASE